MVLALSLICRIACLACGIVAIVTVLSPDFTTMGYFRWLILATVLYFNPFSLRLEKEGTHG